MQRAQSILHWLVKDLNISFLQYGWEPVVEVLAQLRAAAASTAAAARAGRKPPAGPLNATGEPYIHRCNFVFVFKIHMLICRAHVGRCSKIGDDTGVASPRRCQRQQSAEDPWAREAWFRAWHSCWLAWTRPTRRSAQPLARASCCRAAATRHAQRCRRSSKVTNTEQACCAACSTPDEELGRAAAGRPGSAEGWVQQHADTAGTLGPLHAPLAYFLPPSCRP